MANIGQLLVSREGGSNPYYSTNYTFTQIGGASTVDFSNMTIAQVRDYQQYMLDSGAASSAVGSGQWLGTTLDGVVAKSGLDPNTTYFTPQVQDQLLNVTLSSNTNYDGWLAGSVSNTDFQYSVSKTWAAVPVPEGLKTQSGAISDGSLSYYDGVAGNKAGMTSAEFQAAAAETKSGGANGPYGATNVPPGANPGTKTLPQNKAGGQSFGGAGCAGGGAGMPGAMAAAGLAAGQGMAANAAQSAMTAATQATAVTGAIGSTLAKASSLVGAVSGGIGGAVGAISGIAGMAGGAVNTALSTLSGGAFTALGQMGSSILPGLTGVIPKELTGMVTGALVGGLKGGMSGMVSGAVGGLIATSGIGKAVGGISNMLGSLNGVMQMPKQFSNAISQFAAVGGLAGAINTVAKNMVGNQASGSLNGFINNIGMAQAMTGVANNIVGAAVEGGALQFGTGPNGIGANFRNNNDVISYGVTSISRNLPGMARDLLNLGIFETTDLLRLQQPGYVVKQIVCAGLGNTTGLINKLISAGIPLGGVDSPLLDPMVQNILTGINDEASVGAVSSVFKIRVTITNLGQLTDLQHMCPTIYSTSPSKSFADLGQHFISLGLTKSKTFEEIGIALSQIDGGLDLNYISQLDKPMSAVAVNRLIQTFGYGGGSIGEITMADFMGTAGGYVHNDTLPHIINANNVISETAEGQELQSRIAILNNLVDGKYYVPGQVGGTSGGVTTPDVEPSIIIPEFGGKSYTSMDSALYDCIEHVEEQLTVIKNHPDEKVQRALHASEKGHAASCAQILKENHMVKTYNMDLFNQTNVSAPLNAVIFADGLQYHGKDTGYGQMGDFIERVASNDIWGDAVRACLRMGRNAEILEPLGINVERFKLPHSQYLRDPQTFYMDAYTGNLPFIPTNLQDQILPQSPADIYVEMRNQVLRENGYDPSKMLPAQADEKYYDLQWSDCPVNVRQYIGLSALNEVIQRNVFFQGKKGYLTNLKRGRVHFCDVEDNGLLLYDGDAFIAELLAILNKVLYGNIGTTKYENPFDTDKMVYGAYELLGQITPQNIDALMATKLGSLGIKPMLDQIKVIYVNMTAEGQTGITRNETLGWGGSGPDGDAIAPPKRKKP